jgi:uncharacterized RDD family membrane protein YckC
MSFCPKCGQNVTGKATYCPSCGERLGNKKGSSSGIEKIRYDIQAQGLWLSRLLAYIIDSIIVGIFTVLAILFVFVPYLLGSLLTRDWLSWRNILGYPFATGFFQVVYFTILEGWLGASVGKRVIGLVVSKNNGGKPNYLQTLLRNISKIHGGILLLDILFGLTLTESTRMKATDRMSGTRVQGAGRATLNWN